MKTSHPKRPSLIRKLRHWLYSFLMEEQEAQDIHDAALLWHRTTKPCCLCAKPIPENALFCPHCGLTQILAKPAPSDRQTSGSIAPVQQNSPSITDLIGIVWEPDKERLRDAYLYKIQPRKSKQG